ncbi:MAG: hypothetical protein KAJ72_01345 [Candidatus Heimdallarchaeota archaeon]|nr:hypothetical protein [Candidatus Heimdallarchaeota archaeon]
MKKPKRMGTYEHFCVLVTAQGNWKDEDLREIRQSLIDERVKYRAEDYPLIMKLVYRTEKPVYSDCQLCDPIYDLLQKKKANFQGIIYQGHHYLEPEDTNDMVDLVNILIDNDKIKKIYILYLDSFKEFKRDTINNLSSDELIEKIEQKKLSKSTFLNILSTDKFQNRTLYEILKDVY